MVDDRLIVIVRCTRIYTIGPFGLWLAACLAGWLTQCFLPTRGRDTSVPSTMKRSHFRAFPSTFPARRSSQKRISTAHSCPLSRCSAFFWAMALSPTKRAFPFFLFSHHVYYVRAHWCLVCVCLPSSLFLLSPAIQSQVSRVPFFTSSSSISTSVQFTGRGTYPPTRFPGSALHDPT
ncbi:hypothetical protein B0J15DRAFT_137273 [Fusarium solani]|uniref:Uncharacterized protein n=1 Tax=Fusarium solani TaxID=169388 RepID=A0A9P9RE15_FUSSL|nr:uncharacterized protein B0J15DRAFT_137273 [Fusarium solani]KAH7274645.1 hypothetical protein B0J15DRAFT_137273 [Fusarium solani]